ncbi:MAG: glycosyltransferase family 2 protein, partial [Actinobacteria bacterium]|nr:glycosyltransferase family 2 protein [Actinomycetota bacterium]
MTLTGEHRVLVVVPAFNEAESLGSVVSRIREFGFQVVVVDDGSEDQTSDVARAAGARVLTLPINLGVGGALRCGFRYAIESGFVVVVQCDADGQHSPDHISSLIQALTESGASLVIGSRFRS